MEDENKVLSTVKIIRNVLIILAIIVAILISIFLYFTNSNKNKLNNYFKNNGYTEKDGIWSKNIKDTSDDYVAITDYLYTVNTNKFIKNTETNYSNYREQVDLEYNGNDKLSILYSFDGINESNKECVLVQNATYNYVDDKFDCTVKYNYGNCDLRCDVIRKLSDSFKAEVQNFLEEANVNKFLLPKNK